MSYDKYDRPYHKNYYARDNVDIHPYTAHVGAITVRAYHKHLAETLQKEIGAQDRVNAEKVIRLINKHYTTYQLGAEAFNVPVETTSEGNGNIRDFVTGLSLTLFLILATFNVFEWLS